MEFQTNQLEFRQEMSLFQTCRNPRRLPKITDKLMTVFLWHFSLEIFWFKKSLKFKKQDFFPKDKNALEV